MNMDMKTNGIHRKNRTTMEDIARHTGLSKMTVSRVLSNAAYVAEETRHRVLVAARELEYELNYIGRQLNHNRTGMLGVVTPLEGLIGTYYFGQVVKGIQQALIGTDYHIAHYDSLSADFNDGAKCAQLCRQRRVDGLIVIAPRSNDQFVKTFADLNVPLVVVGGSFAHPSISSIDVDNFGGGRTAVEHLIRHGHRKIAFLGGPNQLHDAAEREEAFRKTMSKHGLPINTKWVLQGNYETRKSFHACLSLLSGKEIPTAIFAANDMMALGALDAARILNLSIPGDLSVVGFDDVDAAAKTTPPLTTVRQPMQRIGRKAIEYLLQILSQPGDNHVVREKLSAQLVVRGTTGRVPKRPRKTAAGFTSKHPLHLPTPLNQAMFEEELRAAKIAPLNGNHE
jgi:DNA-binding LacI/PurR family transcriptional regulator